MFLVLRIAIFSSLVLISTGLQSVYAANSVKNVFVVEDNNATKIVFNLEELANYDAFKLSNPDRIVIDINQTQLNSKLPGISKRHEVIKNIRSAHRNNKAQRFVIDTRGIPNYETYVLKPNKDFSYRLVLEIKHDESRIVKSIVKPRLIEQQAPIDNKLAYRDVIVAIDAGHGGQDPGAIGKNGTHEKDVVLDIARRLKTLVDHQSGMRGVLVRKDDRFISLRQRIQIAREEKADIFISIHADSYNNREVKGSSVFVLSEKGASDEQAKWLADQENAADLIGGVSLDDKDATLAQVLLDLAQTATIEASTYVADSVLSEIGKVAPVHKSSVQNARFVVLKSPDIPSLLVETAFISNPSEERRLKDNRYQDQLARAMLKGIKNYFDKNPPPDSIVAQRISLLQVKPGDTLSDLAEEHRVTVADLKRHNKLNSDQLFVGQTLRIPF